MKKQVFILFMILAVFLSACSGEKEEATGKTPVKENERTEEKQDRILEESEKINLEVSEDALLALQPGKLTADLPYEKDTENLKNHENPVTDPSLIEKMPKELDKLAKETEDLEMIKKGLLGLFASPHYKRVIEEAHAYEPQFEEPYLPDPVKSDGKENQQASEKAIILLDASSSMLKHAEGRVKMEIAKDAVKSFAQTIGQSSEVSLVVYGHKGSESNADKAASCSGIEEVYPMGEYSKKEFHQAVDSFESKGWTPLAGAIQKAAEMSSKYEGATTIYIVSDGAETCDGDPVQASKDLAARNSGNTVNIIGFDVDGKTENQLKAVADAGNGEYFKADSPEELKNTIQYEWLPSNMDLAWAFTMAPDGWEMMAERKRAEEYPRKLNTIGRREAKRLLDAAEIMEEKGWISEEEYSELRDWIDNRSSAINDLYHEIYNNNSEKAKTKSEEIRQKVQEWTEKMRALKKQQS